MDDRDRERRRPGARCAGRRPGGPRPAAGASPGRPARSRAPARRHAQAQDAVQETFLLALRKIDQLRDPEAAAGWLHAALRSLCLTRLRRDQGELPLHELAPPPAPARENPEARVDRLALRDWVWSAIGELTEPLRVVAMLRFFGSYSSYDEIASICGVPVGTVRSRLSQVKLKLADGMLATAQAAHAESSKLAATRQREMTDAVSRFGREGDYSRFVEPMTDDVEAVFASGTRLHGRHVMEEDLAGDVAAGVSLVPTAVVAGPGITILEARFVNPPDDPFHCPPAMAQVHYHQNDGSTFRIALHYAAREEPM